MMNERLIQPLIKIAYVTIKLGMRREHTHKQIDMNVNERAKHLNNVPMM